MAIRVPSRTKQRRYGHVRIRDATACPLLIQPESDAELTASVNFSWGSVDGASEYNFYLWAAGNAEPEPVVLQGTEYAVDGLECGSTYRWKVTSVNADGLESSGCQPREFSVVLTRVLIETYYVNISALDFGLSNAMPNQAPVGTTVSVSAQENDVLVISKPATTEDPNMIWDAWFNGNSWVNTLRVSDENAAVLFVYSTGEQVSEEAAFLLASANFPVELTGSSTYIFWARDNPIADNSHGISYKVEQYRDVCV